MISQVVTLFYAKEFIENLILKKLFILINDKIDLNIWYYIIK